MCVVQAPQKIPKPPGNGLPKGEKSQGNHHLILPELLGWLMLAGYH